MNICSIITGLSLYYLLSQKYLKKLFLTNYITFLLKFVYCIAQYGFRSEHSTEYVALELVDRVMSEMDEKNTLVSIFLDLSKAFDILNHEILLEKLNYYGIKGIAHNLLESYLTGRKQYVDINDTRSDTLTLTTGIPQVSILGPLLLLFI